MGTLSGLLLTWVVSMSVGMQPVPGTVPLFNLVRDRPPAALVAGAVVFLVTIAAVLVVHEPEDRAGQRGRRDRWPSVGHAPPVAVAALVTVATLSTSLSVGTVAVVLVRPDWCPNELCPKVPGPHDQFLAADFNAFESPTYVIGGNTAMYTLANLPDGSQRASVAAQRVLASGESVPQTGGYRLSLRVTSLQRGQLGMLIGGVRMPVDGIGPPPSPLRIVVIGAPVQYRVNPYLAVYDGERRGDTLTAAYAGDVRLGYVQLRPGESDQLSIQIVSRRVVDLRFRVRVVYRVLNESGYRTLDLPYVFEAVFSDQLNWQQYRYTGGHLVPA